MPFQYWPPQGGRPEPTYAYDNPANYTVVLSGIRIEQHGRNLRMVSSTPHDIDRISRTPVLAGNDNLALRNLWAAGGPMNVWQRNLKVSRLQQLRDWWFDNAAISANPSLIYFPGMINLTTMLKEMEQITRSTQQTGVYKFVQTVAGM